MSRYPKGLIFKLNEDITVDAYNGKGDTSVVKKGTLVKTNGDISYVPYEIKTIDDDSIIILGVLKHQLELQTESLVPILSQIARRNENKLNEKDKQILLFVAEIIKSFVATDLKLTKMTESVNNFVSEIKSIQN